jgi:hypothetical protein
LFSSEVPNGIQWASFAGNTNIFIKGDRLNPKPELNALWLESYEVSGAKVPCPAMTEEDIFGSTPELGSISYRLPSPGKIFH